MSARPATIEDYVWLHANTKYPQNALGHASGALNWIENKVWRQDIEWCLEMLLDVGGNDDNDFHKWCRGKCLPFSVDPTATNPAMRMCLPNLKLKTSTFWVVTCFDVLEHLPEAIIIDSIRELCRVSNRYVAFTVMDCSDTALVNGELVELHITRRHGDWWLERTKEATRGQWDIEMREDGPNRWLFLLEKNL